MYGIEEISASIGMHPQLAPWQKQKIRNRKRSDNSRLSGIGLAFPLEKYIYIYRLAKAAQQELQ